MDSYVQKPFAPKKYYSIDRVFRNEAVDRTHLAEFHQIEGLVCDRGLTLGDLIGVLQDFFSRLGMSQLRFKPAYNPYTEPSMEIFSYHEGLKKWVEIGNSGMFRPEMLLPMGLPEDVRVIAWGLSLERPTMILYGVDNIRDLFGHKVILDSSRETQYVALELSRLQSIPIIYYQKKILRLDTLLSSFMSPVTPLILGNICLGQLTGLDWLLGCAPIELFDNWVLYLFARR
ncbi:Phenylalanine--tRNA ligase alpha subunit, cytoplasmic [Vitis vinifera]|uniref:phenylalanine--tRNA ligase n=1 Tax=Vitis vinifera TaxID=29760 RepID=A0A438C0Y1_VITVI|nr:Phenylalanine--tRNA ligase alpha subunit, cytoplasmic [Vitis vinifera]